MKTKQIHLMIDEELYEKLRKIAFLSHRSVASLIREFVEKEVGVMEQEPDFR